MYINTLKIFLKVKTKINIHINMHRTSVTIIFLAKMHLYISILCFLEGEYTHLMNFSLLYSFVDIYKGRG